MTISSGRIGFKTSLLAALLSAAGTSAALADIDTIRASDNSLWLAAGASHVDYAEFADGGPNVDTELGTLPAVSGGLSYLGLDNLYTALDFDGALGDLRYNGGYQDGRTFTGNTNEGIWSARYRLGGAIPVGSSTLLLPFVQFGYRHWDRSLVGFAEHYHSFDARGGLLAQYSPSPKLVFSLKGEAGQTFGAGMNAQSPDMGFDLDGKLTWNAEAKAGFELNPRVELFTRVNFDRLAYGRSQDVFVPGLSAYEPNSRTHTLTTQLGVAYKFE